MTQQMAATGKSPKRNHAATMPANSAMMPSENVTAKYPIAMGMPSRKPCIICCLFPAIQYPLYGSAPYLPRPYLVFALLQAYSWVSLEYGFN